MENTSYITLSRATALERQMAIVANNVANMNTTGFKSEAPLFVEYLVKPQPDESYKMVLDRGTARNMAPGPLAQTGNPLDVALEGDGYFQVETLDGPRYTRAGSFTLDAERRLVSVTGLPVLDDTGNTLTIPANATSITISPDGQVATEQGPLGRLGVFTFKSEVKMQEVGGGLLTTDQKPVPAPETRVRQGSLEQSNVQPVVEMTNMIAVSRLYENIQKLMQSQHDLMRNAYSKLSKIS